MFYVLFCTALLIVYLNLFPTTVLYAFALFVEYVDGIAFALFTSLVDNKVKCSGKNACNKANNNALRATQMHY